MLIAVWLSAQKETFVAVNDVSFTISTDRVEYGVQEHIAVKYQIVNVSNGALYVPRGFEATACLERGSPHIRGGFENDAGRHFYGGYGISCGGTPGAAPPTVTQRMGGAAVLLHPGGHPDGVLRLDPSMFRLPPGAYRIGAVLDGWKDTDFSDAERLELEKMGNPFIRGEAPASTPINLIGAVR